ncbi:nicotinamide riboside kinase 1 [Phyllostomus discolor]|uniref:Nicotinamide riboside kinase 1 n=1 Tax=Phyllostomus discolor TaxID=89673 RepID=A0A834B401_9CHIR|nr:nicotinamide riboside kinase 1 [Phyllostomus discolor]
MKTFVIGISGVTNGGKTTLAKNLQKHFPNCSVISQDDFFKPESEIETDENGFLQYDAQMDCPHSLLFLPLTTKSPGWNTANKGKTERQREESRLTRVLST